MALHGKLLQQQLVLLLIIICVQLALAASTQQQPNNPSCNRTCGSFNTPYPFGTGEGCYLDRSFLIICDHSFKPPKLFLGVDNMDVLNISLDGELRVSNLVVRSCEWYTKFDNRPSYRRFSALLNLLSFRISPTKNGIFAVGCNLFAYIRGKGHDENEYEFIAGCISCCENGTRNLVNGSCYGLGCCHSAIPKEEMNYNLTLVSYIMGPTQQSTCGIGFIGETQAYNFSTLDFENLSKSNAVAVQSIPLVLDWAIGNKTCKDAQKNMTSYLCHATYSNCYDSGNGLGYLCNCSLGYQGNPYLPDGQDDSCQDIDECKDHLNPCSATATCTNTNGSYKCTCPKGYEGDGRMPPGTGCSRKLGQSKIIIIAPGVCSVSLLILVGRSSWVYIYLVMQRRKLIELKQKFFQQNGGLILRQQLLSHKEPIEPTKIFSTEELEKATKNYDKSRVLGHGGFGTVYKGVLSDDRVVAIKKSKVVDQSQIEKFINEVLVLSKTNHENVVKLIGCCLETEVPLLVYEFITNGTLFDHIHDKNLSSSLSWEKRLKIASEIAGALAYIHFETSMSIIHRDVKTTNILLDDKHTAKVSDFGASRLVPLDHTQLTTVVLGTLGYLDPEYFHTSQLTEKSDVYSFGVVIVELLTGEKAVSMFRPESERNLAMYFEIALKEDCLLQIIDDRILKEGNIEEITEVANIAKNCLKVRGEDRPGMKQVTKELEGLRLSKKHSLEKVDSNTQQTMHLPNAPTQSLGIDFDVGSSSITTIVGDDSMRYQVLTNRY